jgi:hypothetical protein
MPPAWASSEPRSFSTTAILTGPITQRLSSRRLSWPRQGHRIPHSGWSRTEDGSARWYRTPPQGERGITTKDLYVKPNGSQLTELARKMRDGLLIVDVEAVSLTDGPRVFDIVTSGRSAGKKYVVQP